MAGGIVASILLEDSYGQDRYSIFTSGVLGGTKNLGMSGAMTGLADNYSGALDNPAGPAMTLERSEFAGVVGQLSSSLLNDPQSKYVYGELGASTPLTWGGGVTLNDVFSFSAKDPSGEVISVRSYALTLSQRFLDNRLSIGVAPLLGIVSTQSQHMKSLNWRLGVLYRFPHQIFLGASYRFPQSYQPDSKNRIFTTPGVFSLGASWMVNRFFRAAFSLKAIGNEDQTFMIHLPQEQVGRSLSLQYHLGIDYQFISFKGLDAYLYAGTYSENTRSSLGSRQHYTWGVEVLPLFFQLSAAQDVGPQYQNTILKISFNLGFILENLPIYPPSVKGPSGGVLPNPIKRSEDWLMTHVQDHPEDSFQVIDPEVSDFASPLQKNKAVKGDKNLLQKLFMIFKD